jgi:hypothetical protein
VLHRGNPIKAAQSNLSKLIIRPEHQPIRAVSPVCRISDTTGLFARDSIHLYDHVPALLPISIERLHVFVMRERD